MGISQNLQSNRLSNLFSIVVGLVLLLNSLSPVVVRAAPVLDITSTLVSSGTAPFDANDTAGNDSNNANNIVMAKDSFINKYDYSVNAENATNAYIEILICQLVSEVRLSLNYRLLVYLEVM